MKSTILVILIAMVCLPACKKTSTNTPVNPALESTFDYMPGTYWIYRDSLTGDIDSFFVTNNAGPSSGVPVASIVISISEYSIVPSVSNTGYSWIFFYISDVFDLTFINERGDKYEMDIAPFINYPYSDSFSTCSGCYYSGSSDSFRQTVNRYSSLSIAGNSFTNVDEVDHAGVESYGYHVDRSYNDRYYISPDAGIIKMKLDHPQDSIYRVWELQRGHIVKWSSL